MALMRMEPSEAREIAASLYELTDCYKEFGNALKGIVKETKRLKRLIGDPDTEAGARGSRLISAGLALIALPDPTVTDLLGALLVAAGMLKNRTRETTVAHVCREFQETVKKLENLSKELDF